MGRGDPNPDRKLLDTVLEVISEQVILQDLEHRILFANRAAAVSVGLTPADLAGRRCHEVWHDRPEPCDGCPLDAAMRAGEPREGEIVSPDGRVWSVRGYPVRGDDGGIAGAVEIASEITDWRRTEEAYRSLVEHSLQGIGIFHEGRLVLCNHALAQMVGRTVEELHACSPREIVGIVHPDDRGKLVGNMDAVLEGMECDLRQGYRAVRKDGEVRHLETLVQLIDYRGGKALQVAYWDVTDVRHADEAYRNLVEHSLQGLAIIQEGRLVFANAAITDILGYAREELYELDFERIMGIVHPDDRAHAADNLRGRLAGEDIPAYQQYRIIRKDGTVRWVETMGEISSIRGRPAHQIVYRDITEQKQAQERIRQERDRAQMYLDVAGVMLLALDAAGKVVLINRKGCEILGGTEDEIVGRDWIEHFVPAASRAETREIFEDTLAGAEHIVDHHENPILRLDGEERWIHWSNTLARDGRGRVAGTLSSGEDVTEKRAAEAERARLELQLRQAQKLEAIGTLAGGVAHEINNPVNITMNFARLIQDRVDDGSTVHEYAQEIIDEGERMSSIVRKLLSFARQEKERHSPARMADIVASTVGLMEVVLRKDHIALEVDVPADLPTVRVRSQQIQQVLLNLLTNARDALNQRFPGPDPGKRILIRSTTLEKAGDSWVRTTVEDRGAGVHPGTLGRIFDPFFTTKPREQGTGLGLSVSYGIVMEHRGDLWVESEPGSYTRFHMDLRVDNGWRVAPDERGE